MAKTLMGCHGTAAANAYAVNTTSFFPFNHCNNANTFSVEANFAVTHRLAGVYNYLTMVISANTLSLATTTVVSRISGGDGTLTFAIGAGATGTFTDSTHADTIAAGSTFCVSFAIPNSGVGTITLRQSSITFATGVNQSSYFGSSSGAGIGYATASATRHCSLSGNLPTDAATTETSQQVKSTIAQTFANLQGYVSANTRGTNSTITSRVAAANGNQLATIGAAATGLFEDIVNTDILSAGALINTAVTNGTGVGTLTMHRLGGTLSSGALNKSNTYSSVAAGVARTASGTASFYSPAGLIESNATEANAQALFGFAATLTNFMVYVSANTYTGTATARLRVNAGNGTNTFTIGAGATGLFEDTTHSDSFVVTDLLDYSIIDGTANSMTIQSFGVLIAPVVPQRSTGYVVG